MGSISKNMTGTAWHSQQMSNTCKEGSKRCINNSNGTCIFKGSLFYKCECAGKGECEEFESMSGTPKTVSSKTISYHTERTKPYKNKARKELIAKDIVKNTPSLQQQKSIDEKEYEFGYLSTKRKNKILRGIRSIRNLSNLNLYDYTDTQIDRIFNEITEALEEAKCEFKQKLRQKR